MQKNKFSYLSLCISKLHSQCPIAKMDWLKVLRQSKSINCLSQRKKCNLGSKTKKLALTDIDYFTFNFEFSTIYFIIEQTLQFLLLLYCMFNSQLFYEWIKVYNLPFYLILQEYAWVVLSQSKFPCFRLRCAPCMQDKHMPQIKILLLH